MTRKLIAAVVATLAVAMGLGLNASTATAETSAPTAEQAVEYTDLWYLTGGRYREKEICIWQTFNSTVWYPGDLGNSFEPAVNTGWRGPTQNCSGYPTFQVLRVALYSVDDGHCTKWTGTADQASLYIGHPENDFYNRVWDSASYPTAWINTFYGNCWDNPDEPYYRLGREMANLLGLQPHCNWTAGLEAVANDCGNRPDFANTNDRNRLAMLMNP
jgi:hypothetical protein